MFDAWVSIREAGISPQFASALSDDGESRREFLKGAELLRFHGERARGRNRPQPQQLIVSDMLATGHGHNAVLKPRRSSKSTSLIAVGLGRAASRPDYRVAVFTLTSGKAGRSRFLKDVVPALEGVYPDAATRPFKIVRSAGQERVEWPHDSFMQWISSVDDLRGEAFDLIILDEAGEPEPDKVQEVLAAALPTLDTRPGGQIVVAGTAGKYRAGNLLWDWLERGRRGEIGVVEFSAPQDTTAEDVETWEQAEPLVLATHPGVGTLTTLAAVRGNFDSLLRETFLREYLGVFGSVGGSRFLNLDRWNRLGDDGEMPQPPEHFTLVMAAHADQIAGAIVAVWREEGVGQILVLDHRPGIDWLGARAVELSRRYRVPIVHDSAGAVLVEVERIARERPAPRLLPQRWRDVSTAAGLFVKELDGGRLRHWRQPMLDDAVRLAKKRGTLSSAAWAFGRVAADDDITALEAASMGLRVYDDTRRRTGVVPIMGE